ncbi:UbiA prenyltransferase family protein [Mucilaginibacter sp. E4BP6]|jgi:4-hydroxybenzoate polyprenyltransferase|uniref:UbiA prenyltransferase family protein n=1 Tax=Mucilaginibacter sp. E4BP6 TaxID=2723089 RepID=UPI0015CB9611|nr:UbiA prenyltransferase family protein [Mucilaginibacter sp. E4BP6]NYE65138.1 4-hydroxybenzoate polyprenyltransferase [Mucilaginibacter sp. E4BP6]
MKKIVLYLKLLRVHQWVKNLFIFLPPFFALKLKSEFVLEKGIIAFFAFSMIASATYIFNDMLDISADRLHPTKCKRPLASKEVSFVEGIVLMVILLLASTYLFVFVIKSPVGTFIAGFYLLQNILYTIKLKHISILDVVIISVGFVLRILLGGAVTNTQLSHWIILMTFVFALFLALAKRRDDVSNFIQTGNKSRKNIQGYNLEFLNVSITVMATVVVVCYIMYCTSAEVIARFGDNVYLTSFFVILGILRYLQLTFVWLISGSPTLVLLKNRFLQVIILGWILSFAAIIYIKL